MKQELLAVGGEGSSYYNAEKPRTVIKFEEGRKTTPPHLLPQVELQMPKGILKDLCCLASRVSKAMMFFC